MILTVNAGGAPYDVVIGRGVLERAGEYLDLDRRVLLVADEGVPERFVRTVLAQCGRGVLHPVAPGEGSKSLASVGDILRHMLREGFTRADCVVALGGGMAGDLAGFAASCWMRGVDFCILPTTVLAQVDSSVGGKTAVDLEGVKNAVGAFHQPRGVLIDADALETLPARQFSAGLAEAVKTGMIRDAALFERFERGVTAADIEAIVEASLRVKIGVVERDTREAGERRVLNFGHTVGHAIESVTGMLHGECVALGMLAMSGGEARERLLPVLESLRLPASVRADPDEVYAAMLHDKKRSGDGVTVVRVETPGSCTLARVAPESLREAIARVVIP